jgi:hypothetical protein
MIRTRTHVACDAILGSNNREIHASELAEKKVGFC